jgi:hypothetical protein
LGGLNEGLFNVAYHSVTDWDVNIPAMAPRLNGNKMDSRSFNNWLNFTIVFIGYSLFLKE